jgi:hypothetical protein
MRERLEHTAASTRRVSVGSLRWLIALPLELERDPPEDYAVRTHLVEEIVEWLDREHA